MQPVHWRWLAAILVVTGLLRLPAVLADPVVSVDESRYLRLAAAAPAHPEVLLLHNYHPAYPAVLVPVAAVAPESPERLARLLSLLLALAAVGCAFGLARERFGPAAGLAAAALFALHPGPVEAGGRILSEALYVPAVLGACWALLRLLRSAGYGPAALLGGFAGLAYLTRPEGLAPAAVGLGWLAVGGALRRGDQPASLGRRAGVAAAAAATLLLVAGPYMHSIGGLTRKKATGLSAIDAASDRHDASQALSRIAATWVGPADVPSSERAPISEFAHEWVSSPTPLYWLLALAGAIWLVRRRRRPTAADAVLAGVMLLYLAAHVMLLAKARYLSSRHVWPVACLALPWFGAMLCAAWSWRPVQRPWLGRAAVGATLAAAALLGVSAAVWPWRASRGYLRDAGVLLRPMVDADAGVLATDPRVAYYAGARPLIIGRLPWEQLLAEGRRRGARYIACEEADLARRAEGFAAGQPSGVRKVAELPMEARRGRPPGRFLVYEILKNQ
jgi:hypothetical protein